MENGLNLLDYGRLRKAGDIVSYTDQGRVGDYAFLFDLMIILCSKPKFLQHRYRFREAIKIRDHFLEPIYQQHPSQGNYSNMSCPFSDSYITTNYNFEATYFLLFFRGVLSKIV